MFFLFFLSLSQMYNLKLLETFKIIINIISFIKKYNYISFFSILNFIKLMIITFIQYFVFTIRFFSLYQILSDKNHVLTLVCCAFRQHYHRIEHLPRKKILIHLYFHHPRPLFVTHSLTHSLFILIKTR